MPAPPEVVDSVVQSTVEDHAQRQSRIAYAVALLFFVNGGLSDAERERWLAAFVPWQRQAILDAATRGHSYAGLLWSLQTDSVFDDFTFDADNAPLVDDLLERSVLYADRPIVRARWEASKLKQRDTPVRPAADPGDGADVASPEPVDTPAPQRPSSNVTGGGVNTDPRVRPEVAQARQAAEQAGVLPRATEENSTLSDSMERGAARAAEQAMAETNEAFGAGMDEYASKPGRRVARWLKAPHAGACSFCFLVSTRGYRTAQTAMAAGHRACKCGAKVLYVEPRRNRSSGQADVSNWFWAQELERQGYGLLFEGVDLDADGRAAVVGELFPDVEFPTRA